MKSFLVQASIYTWERLSTKASLDSHVKEIEALAKNQEKIHDK